MKENQIERIAIEKIIDYAKTQSNKVWHQMVMDWNWDNYMAFIYWLTENPNTDKATILMIYWKSNPSGDFFNKEVIEKNYAAGYYKQQLFSFSPEDDEGDDWTSCMSDIAEKNIPQIMFQKLSGESISYPDGFIEGMPENLFYEIENLYD